MTVGGMTTSTERTMTSHSNGLSLRLEKLAAPKGAERVRQAEKDEGHMLLAERAYEKSCGRCSQRIGERPFYRVGEGADERLYHVECTKAL
jgi:hypothetical protein